MQLPQVPLRRGAPVRRSRVAFLLKSAVQWERRGTAWPAAQHTCLCLCDSPPLQCLIPSSGAFREATRVAELVVVVSLTMVHNRT